MKTPWMFFLMLLLAAGAVADDAGKKVFTAVTGPDGIQRASLTGGEYFFDPDHVIAKVNVPMELTVKKAGGFVPHNIAMNSPEAGMKFEESMSTDAKVIRFTPAKTGIYPFSCTKKLLFFKSHEERGMKGVIEVVE